MTSDKAEIESVLNNGRKILFERPELAEMSLDDVLNELDDGTQQMIHDRWGVTAWLVIRSITKFELKDIVYYLSQIESKTLTNEYAGYLLQSECAVNLEALILEAERCGQFEKIVPFISTNLIFETELHRDYIRPILLMLENHVTHSIYHSFLRNYADHITKVGAQRIVEEILGDLSGQVQYDLMRNLSWSWYKNNVAEANEVIGRMLDRGSLLSKRAAIDFLNVSLNYDKTMFRKYFSEIEELAKVEELWLAIIPVFANYIMEANGEEALDELYHQVTEYLKKIPSHSLNAKYSFLESIGWKDEIPKDLLSIFHAVISQPCGKDRRLLELLDNILYAQSQKDEWKAALQTMLEIFSANKYRTDYNDFFNAMHFLNELISRHADEIVIQALKYMLSYNIDQIFFGLGLLVSVAELQNILNKDNSVTLTDDLTNEQIIRLLKLILYYAIDSKLICYMAFQLLKLSQESNERYLDFCMEEVYSNYPATMLKVAEQYGTSKIAAQVHLAETVISAYERLSEEHKLRKIKDLQPSREHQYIFQRAKMEENRRISKRANEQSIFANLVNKKSMKYGLRSAHIVFGGKDQKSYQVTPYHQFRYEVELPVTYVNDPVGYEMQRSAYLSEVIQNAIDNQGSSASIEGEK